MSSSSSSPAAAAAAATTTAFEEIIKAKDLQLLSGWVASETQLPTNVAPVTVLSNILATATVSDDSSGQTLDADNSSTSSSLTEVHVHEADNTERTEDTIAKATASQGVYRFDGLTSNYTFTCQYFIGPRPIDKKPKVLFNIHPTMTAFEVKTLLFQIDQIPIQASGWSDGRGGVIFNPKPDGTWYHKTLLELFPGFFEDNKKFGGELKVNGVFRLRREPAATDRDVDSESNICKFVGKVDWGNSNVTFANVHPKPEDPIEEAKRENARKSIGSGAISRMARMLLVDKTISDINIKDEVSWTALHFQARHGTVENVAWLLRQDPPPYIDIRDSHNFTPLIP